MKKKQGVLIYDEGAVRYNIRFDLNDYYGGLHCGECMDVKVRGKWIPTRIEYDRGWYLVGVDTDIFRWLNGADMIMRYRTFSSFPTLL